MLNENLLWTRAIDPMSGRIVKRETFLGALLVFLGIAALGTLLAIAILAL